MNFAQNQSYQKYFVIIKLSFKIKVLYKVLQKYLHISLNSKDWLCVYTTFILLDKRFYMKYLNLKNVNIFFTRDNKCIKTII